MDLLKTAFMREAMECCHSLWRAGWGENHAGNLTYLLTEEEMARVPVDRAPRRAALAAAAPTLDGKHFLVTRTGAFFKNMKTWPKRDLGIVRITEDGARYEILWGFEGKGLPTSEFPTHLLCHAARLSVSPEQRAVVHCHPTHTIAMTFKEEFTEAEFTKRMWQMNSECILVFPEGVGMLPWMVCGDGAIGPATAEKMKEYRVVIWPYHGIFAAGNSLDDAVGLIETIEKNAQVYMLNGGELKRGITSDQLRSLADAFHLNPKPGILA